MKGSNLISKKNVQKYIFKKQYLYTLYKTCVCTAEAD